MHFTLTSRQRDRNRALRPSVALAMAVAALAGCGAEANEGGRIVTVSPGRSIELVGDEFSFDVKTVLVEGAKASGGVPVPIRLRNQGALAHNLRIYQGDREVGGTPTFQGGMTRSATVSLTPGDYRFVCTVGNHAERGMVGELAVRE